MKIIRADNFGREYIADTLVAENASEYYANIITDLLNSKEHKESPDFYRAVSDDYVLWRGMDELV